MKRRRWPAYLAIGFLVLVALGGVSFVAASALEEHDTFCIVCHTAPEVTYYNRAYMALDDLQAAPPDLATLHYLKAALENGEFRCIDCHQGDRSLTNRIQTLVLGARDVLTFVTGRDDPTIEKHRTSVGWLADVACVSCHTETLLRFDAINNHFHSALPQARSVLARGGTQTYGPAIQRALDNAKNSGVALKFETETINVTLYCADCHQPHKQQPETASMYFMDAELRDASCVSCHNVAKNGPQTLNELRGR